MLFDILAIASILLVIILLKRLVNIFPSLVACMLRWKESMNFEASVKHSLDRDMLAAAMVIPFCLTAVKFGLYSPSFMSDMGENARTALTIGVFVTYCILRVMMSMIVKTHKIESKTAKTADRSSFTFFIIMTILLITTGWFMTFAGAEIDAIKDAMLWISAIIYAIFLLRKTQIFISGCSIFTAFLYLCALEFFPTGALVASALIL